MSYSQCKNKYLGRRPQQLTVCVFALAAVCLLQAWTHTQLTTASRQSTPIPPRLTMQSQLIR